MAGSWTQQATREGHLYGTLNRPVGLAWKFTADASDHTIPDQTITDVSGYLGGVDVEFDGTTPPNSLIVSIKTIGGIVLPGFPATALTASGRIDISPPVWFAGGLIISCSNNTTNSAKATIVPLVE